MEWDLLYNMNGFLALLISKLQFSWRFLGLAGLLLTILLCTLLSLWKKRGKEWYVRLLLCLCICVYATDGSFLSSMIEKNNVFYVAEIESIGLFNLGGGEYVPAGVDWKQEKMIADRFWSSNSLNVKEVEKKGTNYIFTCCNTIAIDQFVEIPLLYYRGYQAENIEDKSQLPVSAGDNGKIKVSIPAGFEGRVQVSFQEPLSWRISELISFITILLIGIQYLKTKHSLSQGSKGKIC